MCESQSAHVKEGEGCSDGVADRDRSRTGCRRALLAPSCLLCSLAVPCRLFLAHVHQSEWAQGDEQGWVQGNQISRGGPTAVYREGGGQQAGAQAGCKCASASPKEKSGVEVERKQGTMSPNRHTLHKAAGRARPAPLPTLIAPWPLLLRRRSRLAARCCAGRARCRRRSRCPAAADSARGWSRA